MKRRRLLTTLAAAPAAPALLAQQPPSQRPTPTDPTTPPAPLNRTPPAAAELPKLETAVPDEVGVIPQRYFSATQFATLRKLSDVMMPRVGELPGALDASAPEFLDFLLSQSPAERQTLYKTGLDLLNAAARKRFSKPFADLTAQQAGELFSPLKEKWSYDPPSDPLARFLWAAKADIRTATVNSKEYATASSVGRRGAAGVGQYWTALD